MTRTSAVFALAAILFGCAYIEQGDPADAVVWLMALQASPTGKFGWIV